MKKVLVISGHTDLATSVANKTILDTIGQYLPETEIVKLDTLYPDILKFKFQLSLNHRFFFQIPLPALNDLPNVKKQVVRHMTTARARFIWITGIACDGNTGFTHPVAAAPQSIFTIQISTKKQKPIRETKSMISFSILLYALVNSQNKTTTRISMLPTLIGMWNSICSAMAPPKISAIAVAMAAATAVTRITFFNVLFM